MSDVNDEAMRREEERLQRHLNGTHLRRTPVRKAPSTVQKTPQSPAPPRKHYEVLTPTAQPRRQSVVSTAAPAPAPAPPAEASTEPSIPFKELLRRANEWSKVEEPVQPPIRHVPRPKFPRFRPDGSPYSCTPSPSPSPGAVRRHQEGTEPVRAPQTTVVKPSTPPKKLPVPAPAPEKPKSCETHEEKPKEVVPEPEKPLVPEPIKEEAPVAVPEPKPEPVVVQEQPKEEAPEPEPEPAVVQEPPKEEAPEPEPEHKETPKKPLPTLTRSVATVHRAVPFSPPPDTSCIKITVPPAPAPAPAPALPPPPVCAACQKPIDDADCTVADGAHYHDACFVCCVCQLPLVEYYRSEDGLRCPACYRMAHPFEVCASCGQPITDESFLVGTMHLHPACFVCAACHAPLGMRYVLHQGRFYCAPRDDGSVPCVCTASPPCAACGRPVVPGDHVVRTEDGARYHSQCFACSVCAACLTTAEYCRVDSGSCSRICCDTCARAV